MRVKLIGHMHILVNYVSALVAALLIAIHIRVVISLNLRHHTDLLPGEKKAVVAELPEDGTAKLERMQSASRTASTIVFVCTIIQLCFITDGVAQSGQREDEADAYFSLHRLVAF